MAPVPGKLDAGFALATFKRPAFFTGATFEGMAGFRGASFERAAMFTGATFADDLMVAVEVDGDDLAGPPVGEPESAVVPPGGLDVGEPAEQDSGFSGHEGLPRLARRCHGCDGSPPENSSVRAVSRERSCIDYISVLGS